MKGDVVPERNVNVRERNFSHRLNGLQAKSNRAQFDLFFHFTSGRRNLIVSQPSFFGGRMAHTIFILGTDPQQCKELREILEARITETVVTTNAEDLPGIKESDTVIITSEEENTGNSVSPPVEQARGTGSPRRVDQPADQTVFFVAAHR